MGCGGSGLSKRGVLAATPLFTALSEQELNAFSNIWTVEKFAKGATVYARNDIADRIYVVGRGTLNIKLEPGQDLPDIKLDSKTPALTGAEPPASPRAAAAAAAEPTADGAAAAAPVDSSAAAAAAGLDASPTPSDAGVDPTVAVEQELAALRLAEEQKGIERQMLCAKGVGSFIGREGVTERLDVTVLRPATVVASTDAECLSLTRVALATFLHKWPKLEAPITACLGDSIEKRLADLPFLKAVNRRKIALLATMLHYVPLKENEIVLEEGQLDPEGNSMFIVYQGSVKAVSYLNGEEKILTVIEAGKFFGEIGLMIDIPRTARVVAREKSLLLELRKLDFQKFLAVANTPQLTRDLTALMRQRTAEHFRKYNVPFFSAIPFEKYAVLAQLCKIEQCQPGHIVFKQGDPGLAFHMIAHGQANVSVRKRRRLRRENSGLSGGGSHHSGSTRSLHHMDSGLLSLDDPAFAAHSGGAHMSSRNISTEQISFELVPDQHPAASRKQAAEAKVVSAMTAPDGSAGEVPALVAAAGAGAGDDEVKQAATPGLSIDVPAAESLMPAQPTPIAVPVSSMILSGSAPLSVGVDGSTKFVLTPDPAVAPAGGATFASAAAAPAAAGTDTAPAATAPDGSDSAAAGSAAVGTPVTLVTQPNFAGLSAYGPVVASHYEGLQGPPSPTMGSGGSGGGQYEFVEEDIVISTLGPGSYFGEAALLADSLREATVTCATRCVILSITKGDMQKFLQLVPEALANFQVKLARYDVKLQHVLYHPLGHELFAQHLQREFAEENIKFWREARRYRENTSMTPEERLKAAREIFDTYISGQSESQVNIISAVTEALQADVYPPDGKPPKVDENTFNRAQQEIVHLMNADSFKRFKMSPLFQDFLERTKEPEIEVPLSPMHHGGGGRGAGGGGGGSKRSSMFSLGAAASSKADSAGGSLLTPPLSLSLGGTPAHSPSATPASSHRRSPSSGAPSSTAHRRSPSSGAPSGILMLSPSMGLPSGVDSEPHSARGGGESGPASRRASAMPASSAVVVGFARPPSILTGGAGASSRPGSRRGSRTDISQQPGSATPGSARGGGLAARRGSGGSGAMLLIGPGTGVSPGSGAGDSPVVQTRKINL